MADAKFRPHVLVALIGEVLKTTAHLAVIEVTRLYIHLIGETAEGKYAYTSTLC